MVIILTTMIIISVYCSYNWNIIHPAATLSTLQRLKQQFRSKKELLSIPLSTSATLDSTYETVYSEDPVDYVYPNHSFVGSTDPSSSHYNPAPSPKPSHKQPLVPHGATDMTPSNYEVPNSKDPQDYTYSVSTLKTDSSSNDYACPTSPKSEAATYGLDEDILYHSVGPSIKPPPTGGKGNKSTHPPSLTPNLQPSKSFRQEGFYHNVEESLKDVSAIYEDPTLPQFMV